jgi:thiamine-phosphate pyrophosphorylase
MMNRMAYEFTPAAERALAAAAAWASQDPAELRVPEVLYGLLAEPECRSALLLAAWGIDADAVRNQFALVALDAVDPGRADQFSAEWQACLQAAENLLFEYPRPLVLATEHLLLGIAAADNEVSRWLSGRGVDVEPLVAEVHRLSGHQPGPLPLDSAGPLDGPDQAGDAADASPPHEHLAALRAVDAAANRADEGLRVVEDYLRFVLDDRHLTESCKAIRHELTDALAVFPLEQRHAARDTLGDVGTDVTLDSEQSRRGPDAVAQASLKRVQQALRSLEEFSKTIAGGGAAPGRLEQLRYRAYTLERAVGITVDALDRLADVRLYAIIDGGRSADAFGRLVESLVAAGVGAIQLRDKRLADRELLGRARLLVEIAGSRRTLSIINDRPDLAVLAAADGVHVGQEELTVKDARRVLGPRGLIGVSTHSIEQARAAVLDGANYLGVGPTFPSATKDFATFPGTELLRLVAAEIRLPAFAIGGITLANLAEVLACGVRRVAVSGAVAMANDPGAAAREFLALLGRD